MQAGCRDVVRSSDAVGISGAVSRAQQLWSALHSGSQPSSGRHRAHITTVLSPQGGVGKTTPSVNLPLAPKDTGARNICMIDLALASCDAASNLPPSPTHPH